MNNDWITVRQAGEITGYSLEYIRQLVRKGKVAAQKFGWQVVVDRKSLLEYIERNPGPRSQED